MSISSEISRISGKVSDSYTAVSNKGGTLPQSQTIANLPTAIASIPTSGSSVNLQDSKTVTAGTSRITVSPDSGYDAMEEVKVDPFPNGSVDAVTLDQDLLNKYIKFSSASSTDLTSSSTIGNVVKTISAFKVTTLGGNLYEVSVGGQLFTSATNTATIPLNFTPVGCVMFQLNRYYTANSGTNNKNRVLAIASNPTPFGTTAAGVDRYFGGTYGSDDNSYAAYNFREQDQDANFNFGQNSVVITPKYTNDAKTFYGLYGWVVWGRRSS